MTFLLDMYSKGYASSSLNLMRSTLNLFFSASSNDFANDILIFWLFSFFYKKRPQIAQYTFYWPVEIFLHFLKSWHPVDQLSLKQLIVKTLVLIAIPTSDRGETLNLKNDKKMYISDAGISFIITNKLKTIKWVLQPKIV